MIYLFIYFIPLRKGFFVFSSFALSQLASFPSSLQGFCLFSLFSLPQLPSRGKAFSFFLLLPCRVSLPYPPTCGRILHSSFFARPSKSFFQKKNPTTKKSASSNEPALLTSSLSNSNSICICILHALDKAFLCHTCILWKKCPFCRCHSLFSHRIKFIFCHFDICKANRKSHG